MIVSLEILLINYLFLYIRYYSSSFITRNSWETDNEDGTKTYYIFKIDNSSMPKA